MEARMRRVLSIWLPQLPLDLRIRKGDPRVSAPFAIISEIKNAWRLTHLSETAREVDITGCAHLFGGERAMADHARARLSDMNMTSRMGIADTKGAAWALARFSGGESVIAPEGKTALKRLGNYQTSKARSWRGGLGLI